MLSASQSRRSVHRPGSHDDPVALGAGVVPSATTQPATMAEGANAGMRAEPRQAMLLRLTSIICMHNDPARVTVHYPMRCLPLALVFCVLFLNWIFYFQKVVSALKEEPHADCRHGMKHLRYNAIVFFVYLVWFCISRSSLLVPFVLARVARVQTHTHGFYYKSCVQLVWDSPACVLVVASILCWFNIVQSPECEEKKPELYFTLRMYAAFTCLLAMCCMLVAYWQNEFISGALDLITPIPQGSLGASADTLDKLETRRHDSDDFRDAEGAIYPSDCAICLQAWETDDVIKVTPCGHMFHKDCIDGWLQSARTCALCRKDIVDVVAKMEASSQRSAPRPDSQTRPVRQLQVPVGSNLVADAVRHIS